MQGIESVEGKDCPTQLGKPKHDKMGSTVGLLLWMLVPIFHMVMLDSGFCVLKGIIKLH